MTKNLCRKCKTPCGSFHYCRAHRAANAKKARARYHARTCRRTRFSGLPISAAPQSAPTASEAFFKDAADRAAVAVPNSQSS